MKVLRRINRFNMNLYLRLVVLLEELSLRFINSFGNQDWIKFSSSFWLDHKQKD